MHFEKQWITHTEAGDSVVVNAIDGGKSDSLSVSSAHCYLNATKLSPATMRSIARALTELADMRDPPPPESTQEQPT